MGVSREDFVGNGIWLVVGTRYTGVHVQNVDVNRQNQHLVLINLVGRRGKSKVYLIDYVFEFDGESQWLTRKDFLHFLVQDWNQILFGQHRNMVSHFRNEEVENIVNDLVPIDNLKVQESQVNAHKLQVWVESLLLPNIPNQCLWREIWWQRWSWNLSQLYWLNL